MSGKTPSIKERRTRILLTLFLLDKDKLHDVFEKRVKRAFALPSDTPRSRGTIRQMIADSIIEKKDRGTYRITESGVRELALSFPFVRFLVFQWDGFFRILSYEIPEKKRSLRDSLRREVSGWGFGPWHRSFWITPHPITNDTKALIERTNWAEYVQMFEGKTVIGDKRVLLEKVWNLIKLEADYKRLFKIWHETLSKESLDKYQKFSLIISEYITVLKNDPGLPKELVGDKWIGFEAYDIFKEMRDILFN